MDQTDLFHESARAVSIHDLARLHMTQAILDNSADVNDAPQVRMRKRMQAMAVLHVQSKHVIDR